MRRMLLVAMLVLAGCSVEDEPNLGTPPPRPTAGTVPTSTSTSTSTVDEAVASVGLIRVGPAAFDLTFTCIAPGAGEILAVGIGTDVNGKRVEAYVQAFLGDPFVGMVVGDGADAVRFEPRLGRPLVFSVTDDVVRFDDVDFVSDLDLETGQFTPAGLGSVVVECRDYDRELPGSVFS